MIVTLYNEGGLITNVANLSQDTIELLSSMGHLGLVDVEADPKTQYVKDEKLFQYTEEEILARENLKPGWVWQMPEKIAVDIRELEQTRIKTIEWINNERDRLIAAFDRFTYNGNLFDGNAAAEKNIEVAYAGAMVGIELPPGFTWRLFDNTDVPFTNEDIIGMQKAFLEAANLNRFTRHGMARYLKDQVPNINTTQGLDDLKNIPWPNP